MQVIAAAMPSTRLTSVVFCCGTEVGKTALVNRYAGGDFDPKYVSTVGYHCHVSLARVLTLPSAGLTSKLPRCKSTATIYVCKSGTLQEMRSTFLSPKARAS